MEFYLTRKVYFLGLGVVRELHRSEKSLRALPIAFLSLELGLSCFC